MKSPLMAMLIVAALAFAHNASAQNVDRNIDRFPNHFDSHDKIIRVQYVPSPKPLWEGFGSYRELQEYRRLSDLANRDAMCPVPAGGPLIALAQWELKYARCRLNNAIKAGAGNTHKRVQAVVAAERKLLAAQRRAVPQRGSDSPQALLDRLRVTESNQYDVNGKKHGYWVERQPNGDVAEDRYINGKRHDHWVARWADGNVTEGAFVDGKMHGHWVLRCADGSVVETCWENGNRVEC